MIRSAGSAAILLAASLIALTGESLDPRLRDADLAWDRGDYPAALNAYLALLESPDASRFLEPIALQTGELFQTIELTADGGTPRFSPDGRHFTYETGRGLDRTTRLAAVSAPTVSVAELPGYGAAFSPDGAQLAYLKLAVTSQMREVEQAAEQLTGAERTKRLAALAELTETAARIMLRDLRNDTDRELDVGRRKSSVLLANDGVVLFTSREGTGPEQIYVASDERKPAALTAGEPDKILGEMSATGSAALFTHRVQRGRGRGAAVPRFGIVALPPATVTVVAGSAPALSADGRSVAYVTRTDSESRLMLAPIAAPDTAKAARTGSERLDAPAWSNDGTRIAFQTMSANDWEIHVIARDGSSETRVTREIQHDLLPRFLSESRLLGTVGEARHRRSYLYDLATGNRTRLFHNNTIRTIAPEYVWVPSPDGTKLLVVAERDGDTVSPERGVYMMDLTRKVSADDVRARLRASLRTEQALRARGQQLYAAIAAEVRRVVADVSIGRIFDYQKSLFDFDSKHISRPGNKLASEYLFNTYRSFGYEPQYQWFAERDALDGQTANVLATLRGTVNPELVYVVSSHYDSVAGGPGADDDSSGTAALLEAARILAKHPQPATIVFASFTGEEANLVGSREFVRRAVADKMQVVGALNNDMVGWTNDHRLDNTIRYSNPGIRDVQHAAALQFSGLITYDALYFKGTDAHAYHAAWGDIGGGIGSYPVLGNPHYHQPHDTLDTINHQLVTEVAKTTVATLMLLASSPSRVAGLKAVANQNGDLTVTWAPSPEKGVNGYIVAWGPPEQPESQQIRVAKPGATIRVRPGFLVSVKGINDKGLEGWDWARLRIESR